ncbi:uncharacterized protein LOC116302959 [Actinia tenebrosa]|uniref:Uncharacterized protein LOC116302959 n=1 Tax=Actinia tenebrosa TaxID=6105 RepID=A0A6P8IPF2_ACTTE|nr:uncharacterized protein LOC116302959 [Actinia tenebrosa]
MSEIIDCMVFIVQKTCWSLWKFTEFVGKRILDLLGLVFNILACLTVIRLPCMIQQFLHMEDISQWRYVGFVQLIIFIMDIPVIIMGLISLVLTMGFVLIPFLRKVKKKGVKCDYTHQDDDIFFGGFMLRKIVVGYFVRVMCDIFCIPLGLICLCSWRGPTLIRKIKKKKNWEDLGWRKVCIVQFFHLVVDIPCLVCGILLMVTWRGPYLIYVLYKRKEDNDFSWNADRFEVFLQLFLLFTDLIFLSIFLVTMITWRGPLLIYELVEYRNEPHSVDEDEDECIRVNSDWVIKYMIAKHATLIFVDIPCIICALIVMVTLWRFPSFVRNCTKDEWELRKNCLTQFVLLLIDFVFLLLNILCLILSVVVLATLWRAYPLIKDLKKYFKQRSEIPQTPVNESEQQKKERKNLRNKNSWKIRKAAFKHFGFLFIDIPAIAACVLILVTLVRFPKLLSKLLQAGDFYMEFALISFGQLVKLIVDVVFILLFIVLMIMRPIQSWVHLLEDEEHRKMRLLRFYMQWVPDIIDKRHTIRRKMEEVFSQSLKNKSPPFNIHVELSIINAEFLKDLDWVRSKIKKYELDDQYDYLLHMIQFYEGKRAYKLHRLYLCELNYLHCANSAVHNENLFKYRNEMIAFEHKVDSAIRELKDFKVQKVPLWTNESGLRTRTRQETQQVLIKCLPSGRFLLTILIILNLLLIYRGPALIRNLCRRWYDRKKIVFKNLREYLKDFVTVVIILLVLLTVYRAPFLLVEVANDVISKRSWNAVRETVRRYPPKFAQDLVDLMVTLLSWKSIRFVFTATLFGILMPADLFLRVMKFAFKNTFFAILSTVILYFVFFGFPFVLTFKMAPSFLELSNGLAITVSIGVFGILLLLILIIASILTFKHRESSFSIRPKAYDYVRFNWTNAHALIFEFVEFLQLLALVFVVSEIPMYGAATLNKASQYLLLSFATFEVKFWLTIILFILWFFCCGLPVILEQVLETFDEGTFAKQVSWTLSVSLFTNTLFVTFFESFLSFVACKYDIGCTPVDQNFTGNATNLTSCPSAVLYDDQSIQCWNASHQGVAVFGLLALVWYTTTAVIFGTRYGDSDHPSLDLKFSPVYNVLINFAKALMVGLAVLAVANPYFVFGSLIFVNMVALIFTLQFRKFIGFNLSNSFVLILWRIVSFVSAAIAAVSAIIAKVMNDPTSKAPLFVFLAGVGVVLVLAVIISITRIVRRALTPMEHKRKEFRTCLRQLEDKLVRDNYMVNSWHKNRKRWRRLVRHVYEAQKNDDKNISDRTVELPAEMSPPPIADIQSRSRHSLVPELGMTFSTDVTQNLPPPPTYQELFPNIMGSHDGMPPPPPYYAQHGQSELVPINSPPSGKSTPENTAVNEEAPGQNPAEDKPGETISSDFRVSVSDDAGLKNSLVEDEGEITSFSDTKEVKLDIDKGTEEDEEPHEVQVELSLPETGEGARVESDEAKESPAFTEDSDFDQDENKNTDDTKVERSIQQAAAPLPANQYSELQDVTETQIDSILFLQSQFRTDGERRKESDPVLSLECNGKNLLLVLEEHIHYSAFSFSFITQIPMWRHSVENADWTQLVECLRILESNLSFTFNSPTRVDVACADQHLPLLRLPPDPDQVPLPVFVPEPRDPEEIRALADAERSRCLQDVATLEPPGDKWAVILDKILPTKPVLKKWFWDSESHEFALYFHRGIRGTITDVGPRGLKLAKGASISISKVIKGHFPISRRITFQKGFQPKGGKGPVSVTVSELGILEMPEKTYITAQDKRLALDKALDCLHEIAWK